MKVLPLRVPYFNLVPLVDVIPDNNSICYAYKMPTGLTPAQCAAIQHNIRFFIHSLILRSIEAHLTLPIEGFHSKDSGYIPNLESNSIKQSLVRTGLMTEAESNKLLVHKINPIKELLVGGEMSTIICGSLINFEGRDLSVIQMLFVFGCVEFIADFIYKSDLDGLETKLKDAFYRVTKQYPNFEVHAVELLSGCGQTQVKIAVKQLSYIKVEAFTFFVESDRFFFADNNINQLYANMFKCNQTLLTF